LVEFLNWLLEVAPQRKCVRRARAVSANAWAGMATRLAYRTRRGAWCLAPAQPLCGTQLPCAWFRSHAR